VVLDYPERERYQATQKQLQFVQKHVESVKSAKKLFEMSNK